MLRMFYTTLCVRMVDLGASGKERSIFDGNDGHSDEHRKSSKEYAWTFDCGVGPTGRRELISGSPI